MKRRNLLLAGAAGTAGLIALARPRDRGDAHPEFFEQLSAALDNAGAAKPTLIVDRTQLRRNVAILKNHLQDRFDYRIVAKSLPSLSLLEDIMSASDSHRLMLFHQPFVNAVATQLPDADILLGKPMPAAAAHNFYREFKGGTFDPARQLQWLVDTPERMRQYSALASAQNTTMRVSIELDVGLHRGGVSDDHQLLDMLSTLQASPYLSLSGLMGYEPHIIKIPGDVIGYRDKAMGMYEHYLQLTKHTLGAAWPEQPVLNAAGSPTYQLYNRGQFPCNELAAGSCLVKPTDFDLPTLADHSPASWIAAPVLKTEDSLRIPGIDLGPLQSLWDPNRARTFFTYGGYWKAEPVSPPGLRYNTLYGRSTNQEMLNGSSKVPLAPDDWIFLRPTQSEFVFLQFGDIAVLDNGVIVDHWPVFS
ncbi:MAG: DSD1 family PLP-dependent enzyme [Pseudomonadota bacterium]